MHASRDDSTEDQISSLTLSELNSKKKVDIHMIDCGMAVSSMLFVLLLPRCETVCQYAQTIQLAVHSPHRLSCC